MIAFALFLGAACVVANPDSDRILARDLATQVAAFAAAAPEAEVGIAPAPGVRRIFRLPELRALATRLHLDKVPETEFCVERPVFPPETSNLLEAMRRSLSDAHIQILDFSRQPLPAGVLEFPLAGLRAAPGGAIWSGHVTYGGGRHFRTWAKVDVTVRSVRVVAKQDLKAGVPIAADQVQVEERDSFPVAEPFAESAVQVVGKVPRTLIRSSEAIRSRAVADPPLVERGDTVRVEVQNGGARLVLEAQAEAAGSRGDRIPVRNTETQRRFQARVEAKGLVSVGGPRPEEP